jgi:hypothetical protein
MNNSKMIPIVVNPGFTTILLANGKQMRWMSVPVHLEGDVIKAIDAIQKPFIAAVRKEALKQKRR